MTPPPLHSLADTDERSAATLDVRPSPALDDVVVSFLAGASLTPHASVLHDGEGRPLARNDRADALLGPYSAPSHAVVDGRELPLTAYEMPWNVAARLGHDVEHDLCLVDHTGGTSWVTAYARVTDHAAGRVVVTSIVDTTFRQRWARDLLGDFRARFETSWRSSTMPVFVLDGEPDAFGRVLFANDAMHRLVGASAGGLAGTELSEWMDPGDRAPYHDGLLESLAHLDGEQTVQVSFCNPGTAFPHPALLGLTVSRGQLGRPAFVVGFAIDHEPLAAAERARHQSLRRAEVMYEQSVDLVVFVTADGILEMVGPSVESLLGYDRAALRGVHALDLVHPEDAPVARAGMAQSLAEGGRSESMRLRIRDAAGEWHPVEIVSMAGGDHSELDGLVVTVRDRAREEELEREANSLDERARQIVELAVDGIWVLDASSNTTYVNAAMARMLGVEREQMMGASILDFMDEDARSLTGQLVERRRAGIEEEFYFPLRHADGRTVRTFVSTRPMLGDRGEYLGAVAWISDVTERLVAAERLEASEAHLRALLGAFPDVVVRMDAAGTYLELYNEPDAAAAESTRAILGRTVVDVFPEDEAPGVAQRCLSDIGDALAGRTVTTEYQLTLDRGRCWFEARFAPLGDGQVLSLVRDVTELRRAEAARNGFRRELERRQAAAERLELERELERAGRLEAMGHLAGGVAHDVNNLLGVIGNYAAAIDRSSTEAARVREDAGEIRRAVERGAALTRQLLLVGRSDATTPRLECEVGELVEALAATLRRSFPAGAELTVSRSDEDCHVEANRGRLEQAVMNLVVNARDALGDRGRVHVEVARRTITPDEATERALPAGEHVVVSVTDDGHGMSDGVRASAFRPFFTTKSQQGTGLGLTIVKAVAEEHGGSAKVTTSPSGTTVAIWLPAATRSLPVTAEGDPGAAGAPPEDERVVLLVDDDEHVRRSTARLLRELGYRVLQAADGTEALEWLDRTSDLAAVVTDVRMPGMSGPQLAARVQLLRPGLPVVFVTGFADEVVRDRSGSHSWLLTKPYDPRQLARTLDRALATRAVAS